MGDRRAVRIGMGVIVLFACAASGCVERRFTIRSDPPGALVIVNGQELGTAPASASYTYYHDRDITLILDGYQTKRIQQPMNAPWWDNLITEFFTENLVPVTLRDEREFVYKLEPTTLPPTNELLNRGEQLREEAKSIPPKRRKGLLGFLGM